MFRPRFSLVGVPRQERTHATYKTYSFEPLLLHFQVELAYQQSGTSIHVKGHINRNGDPYLRAQLYVASWSMIKYNTACKELYTRLKERGKSGKLALGAVINKSIRQCFAVVKHDTDYQDGFVSEKPQPLPAGSACRQGSVGTLPTRQ